MASIFTYNSDPPRIYSPWISSDNSARLEFKDICFPTTYQVQPRLLSEYGITKLQAEPQNGPIEYKLHLLLRPRRIFTMMSTIDQECRSNQAQIGDSLIANATVSAPAASNQPRQQRLQHLTTQLLWRLQQSYPYHASNLRELIIPKLADDIVDLKLPVEIETLVPGLEESRGALYEIGVSDNGTLVGLTEDEMDETLATLEVMAASLGCGVGIVRKVIVGDCEWIETTELVDNIASTPARMPKQDKLWVAEALVTPNIGLQDCTLPYDRSRTGFVGVKAPQPYKPVAKPTRRNASTQQLRATLTGPTTSGKSSLLGTLSTGTLDNGRGKSRLSLLKHRHEMATGVTSSIAHELIGYKGTQVLNYAHSNIESWIDIHDYSEKGRLVLVSDTGGHPRYRRTVLRGLVNWAPHWSILCIAADDAKGGPGSYGMSSPAHDIRAIDPVKAHLALPLTLDLPMAVVITKLDLASKVSLQKTLAKILGALKGAGRIPKILQPGQCQNKGLNEIPQEDYDKVQVFVASMAESRSLTKHVPIILISTVNGTGIGLVHALLGHLPLPPSPTAQDYIGTALNPEQPQSLFHIDDTFTLTTPLCPSTVGRGRRAEQGIVVSGHVRFGSFFVGGIIVVGPFSPDNEYVRGLGPAGQPTTDGYGLSILHHSSAEFTRITMKNAVSASAVSSRWHNARVVSARNLRLPVQTLEAGQAGSIGLVFDDMPRIRRGMVIAIPSNHMLDAKISLQAASGIKATFTDYAARTLSIGSFVNVWVASVRTAARILNVSSQHHTRHEAMATDEIYVLDMNGAMKASSTNRLSSTGVMTDVSLKLLHNREWVELGSQIMIVEMGSQDSSGLEGHVGKITEIVD